MHRPIKVLAAFGTRPDAIKMAPVVAALDEAAPEVESIVCVTAQHREMLDDVLETFRIRPAIDLDIMRREQTLSEITTRVISGMEPVLAAVRPDVVLVHGDTTTSIAVALAAFYARVPVGHVEAGLRTGDAWDPFPEEMNRRLTGTIARYHFAPTAEARKHLLAENVDPSAIVVTGNTVIDAFIGASRRLDGVLPPRWNELDQRRPIIFVTAHRRENHDAMGDIAAAMGDIARLPSRPQIYWPVHPSPRVAPIVRDVLAGCPNVVLVDPIRYVELVAAVHGSNFVMTDSGGLQEEAPCLAKPVLVMRRTTERPEGVRAGTLELVGAARTSIVDGAERLLTDDEHFRRMACASNPYGDGRAARRIVDALLARFGRGREPLEFDAVA